MTTLEEPKSITPSTSVFDVEQGVDLEKPLSEQPKMEEAKGLSKLGQKTVEQFEEKQKEKQPSVEIPKSEVVKKESTRQRAITSPTVTATEEIFEPELPQQLQGIEGGKVNLAALQSIAPMRGSVTGLEEIPHPSLNTIQRQIGQLASANRLPSLWGMSEEEKNASEIVATKIVELARSAKQISPDLNVRAFITNARGASEYPDAEQYLTAIEDEIWGSGLKNELYETHTNTRGASIADNEIHEAFEAVDHPVTRFENNAGLILDRDQDTSYGDNYAEYKPESEKAVSWDIDDKDFDILSGTHKRKSSEDKTSRLEKRLQKYDQKIRYAELKNAVKLAEKVSRELE